MFGESNSFDIEIKIPSLGHGLRHYIIEEFDIKIGISPLGHGPRDLVYGQGDGPCYPPPMGSIYRRKLSPRWSSTGNQ